MVKAPIEKIMTPQSGKVIYHRESCRFIEYLPQLKTDIFIRGFRTNSRLSNLSIIYVLFPSTFVTYVIDFYFNKFVLCLKITTYSCFNLDCETTITGLISLD